MEKEAIIRELRLISERLNKSPGRREVPNSLYLNCVKEFDLFNNAKLESGLSIIKRKCDPLNKSFLKLDKKLVRIISYLTFDGHLSKDLTSFHFSSNNREELEKLRGDVYYKFNIGVFKIEKGNGYRNNVLKYWYFNTSLCKFLHSVGVPKGSKVLTKFDVPQWIKDNKEFAREYLKIAYFCEGSKSNHSKNTETIKLNLSKSERLLEDGLKFMNSIKYLLNQFDIYTTNTWITKGNMRKDGEITKVMNFKIKADSFNKFINQIGWLK